MPAAWIERVMQAESGGRTVLNGRPIISRAGAMGLMQVMPGTWAEIRSALGLGSDPFDPRDNILAGTFYLRRMFDRFGYPACSPPIMRDRPAMRRISRGVSRCRRKPGPISPPSPGTGCRRPQQQRPITRLPSFSWRWAAERAVPRSQPIRCPRPACLRSRSGADPLFAHLSDVCGKDCARS